MRTNKGLGRKRAPDARDENFPMRARIERPLPERSIIHHSGPVLDQRDTQACVGHAWRAWMTTGPIMYDKPAPSAMDLYFAARKIDEWPDNDEVDDGTSVRAGAKILQAQGHLREYVWARDSADVVQFLLARGPVVLGTEWYESMFTPDELGFVKIDGRSAGGHAYLCYGYDAAHRAFRCQNSWSMAWGMLGKFYIARADLDRLLREGGEACGALEVRPKQVTT